jgi:hypothetical protein
MSASKRCVCFFNSIHFYFSKNKSKHGQHNDEKIIYSFVGINFIFVFNSVDFVATQLLEKLTSKAFAKEIAGKIDDHKTSQDPVYYGAVKVATEDHGTAHISVLASNGDAVSVTSSINF